MTMFGIRRFEPLVDFQPRTTAFDHISDPIWGMDTWLREPHAWQLNGAVDLGETDTTLFVHMNLPGYRPENVSVQEQHGVLTVRAERHNERRGSQQGMQFQAQQQAVIQRSFRLPAEVDADGADATLCDGVLTITLPKRQRAAAHRITINRHKTPIKVRGHAGDWFQRLRSWFQRPRLRVSS
jgi:HSP20 family protein